MTPDRLYHQLRLSLQTKNGPLLWEALEDAQVKYETRPSETCLCHDMTRIEMHGFTCFVLTRAYYKGRTTP